MKTQSIAAKTGVGAVELGVTDGDRALRFYRDYVGLTPLASMGSEIRLGAAGRELVVLHPDAERPVVPRRSGLYHLAIVVPDRRELARVIARLGRLQWDQYPTDHVMTKANYLWDPDGYRIELPAKGDLHDVVGRLEHGRVQVVEEAGGLAAIDPSANRVLFRVA